MQATGPAGFAASRAAFVRVAEAHLAALVQQQLTLEGVASAELWGPILVKLAQQAAASLSPTAVTANGNIDPRHYVKVPEKQWLAYAWPEKQACLSVPGFCLPGLLAPRPATIRKRRRGPALTPS